jgi:hypothetical protein
VRCRIVNGVRLKKKILPAFLGNIPDKDLRQRCVEAGERYAREFPADRPFASPTHWAPFIATGLSYPLTPLPRRENED